VEILDWGSANLCFIGQLYHLMAFKVWPRYTKKCDMGQQVPGCGTECGDVPSAWAERDVSE